MRRFRPKENSEYFVIPIDVHIVVTDNERDTNYVLDNFFKKEELDYVGFDLEWVGKGKEISKKKKNLIFFFSFF